MRACVQCAIRPRPVYSHSMELHDDRPAFLEGTGPSLSSSDTVSSSIRITTLPNGLRVATDIMPHVESASENGVAHLLEHMLFKGTERRSAQAIAEEIEAVGGQMNAYTARENTAYYARVLKDDVALAVDIVADLLQHSVF